MEDLNASKRAHKLILNNRRTCNLTGVSDVLSFDENEIILETDQGMLMIKGNELHVNRYRCQRVLPAIPPDTFPSDMRYA